MSLVLALLVGFAVGSMSTLYLMTRPGQHG